MKAPNKKPVVKLLGEDGNAFAILGKVISALKKSGADKEYIEKYKKEATSGDYDTLLTTSMKYAEFQ